MIPPAPTRRIWWGNTKLANTTKKNQLIRQWTRSPVSRGTLEFIVENWEMYATIYGNYFPEAATELLERGVWREK